ncbi:hypothetical protein [Aquisalinus flavus]|uniref:Uncharacterized protein n=1 Tax=Aquisalinus flavus TaxID=1526572 RepID=A0A8J2Y673_9PROT|nr:hypothetical protein [Aquisalinus flavus]MBD0427187.1 hypothetical protein [Aquisalinus flavus]UNE47003.1 hypothetical protein FF099_02495 [Aquisalinus flavus]GGC99044.1 hypothetical protein GCM10011342_05010 [Aquisalinus flavus]
MSLIERAATARNRAMNEGERDADGPRRSGGGETRPVNRASAGRSLPVVHPQAVEGVDDDLDLDLAGWGQVFELDRALLARQGFLVPDTRDKRLALEMRAVKRRLLRRLNFYRMENAGRRRPTPQGPVRNTVLFTSTRPAEGKTFSAINLALSLALEDNISVLLIDADVPRPKIFHHFGLDAGDGLTDYVLDTARPLDDLVMRERDYPLSLLSQGKANVNPVELFASEEMSRFVQEVSRRYPDRIIIFDAPPVLATPEAVVLARHVDETVFLVEANETPEPAVAIALEELLDNNENISLILNKCLAPQAASHYGSYEEYYAKGSGLRSSHLRSREG